MPHDFSQYAADRAAIEQSLSEIEATPVSTKKKWGRIVTVVPLVLGLLMVVAFVLAIWI